MIILQFQENNTYLILNLISVPSLCSCINVRAILVNEETLPVAQSHFIEQTRLIYFPENHTYLSLSSICIV